MIIWFRYAGSTVVKVCKWITGVSATATGIYGIIANAYTIPHSEQIVTAGACISAIAMLIVGKSKPVIEEEIAGEDENI